MLQNMRRVRVGALVLGLVLLTSAGALADHHEGHGTDLRGVVTAFTLTPPTTSTTSGGTANGSGTPPAGAVRPLDHGDGGDHAGGTPIGTLTLLSPSTGSVTLTVLTTTRFEVSGQALATNLVGAVVNVQAQTVNGTLEAFGVESSEASSEALRLKGVVTAITSSTIAVQTEAGTVVTAALDPAVTVTVGDNQPGTLADVTVGAHIVATWKLVNGQFDVVAIDVHGGSGDHGGNGDHASGDH